MKLITIVIDGNSHSLIEDGDCMDCSLRGLCGGLTSQPHGICLILTDDNANGRSFKNRLY